MIWYQEFLFPSHEHSPPFAIWDRQGGRLTLVLYMPEGRKPRPMLLVVVFCSAPFLCQKAMPTADDLSIKVGRQFRPIFRQALNLQIST